MKFSTAPWPATSHVVLDIGTVAPQGIEIRINERFCVFFSTWMATSLNISSHLRMSDLAFGFDHAKSHAKAIFLDTPAQPKPRTNVDRQKNISWRWTKYCFYKSLDVLTHPGFLNYLPPKKCLSPGIRIEMLMFGKSETKNPVVVDIEHYFHHKPGGDPICPMAIDPADDRIILCIFAMWKFHMPMSTSQSDEIRARVGTFFLIVHIHPI